MPDLLTTDDYISISNVGCGMTRRCLLGMEPGSRIWLEVEGEPLLFERAADDAQGRPVRALRAAPVSAAAWERLCRDATCLILEVMVIERPSDLGRSSVRWADDDLPAGVKPVLLEQSSE